MRLQVAPGERGNNEAICAAEGYPGAAPPLPGYAFEPDRGVYFARQWSHY
jgi:hypothetical protein